MLGLASKKELEELRKRLDGVERRLWEIDSRTRDYDVYVAIAGWDDAPIVSISLWQMIHRILGHLGLQIKAEKSKGATWVLEKHRK